MKTEFGEVNISKEIIEELEKMPSALLGKWYPEEDWLINQFYSTRGSAAVAKAINKWHKENEISITRTRENVIKRAGKIGCSRYGNTEKN